MNNYDLYIAASAVLTFITWFAVHCFSSVHYTQCILESRRLWPPPPFLVDTVNRYLVLYAAMKYAVFYWSNFIWILMIYTLSNIHVLALVYKEIEISDPWISKRFWSHSRALTVTFFVLLLWRHWVEWHCDVIADVDNDWGECIVPIGSEMYA